MCDKHTGLAQKIPCNVSQTSWIYGTTTLSFNITHKQLFSKCVYIVKDPWKRLFKAQILSIKVVYFTYKHKNQKGW